MSLDKAIESGLDWKIHKKLNDVQTLYICPARGSDKIYTQLEIYARLLCGDMRPVIKLDEGWDYIIPGKNYSNF